MLVEVLSDRVGQLHPYCHLESPNMLQSFDKSRSSWAH
jgi:hypothetical protein